jgi:hypothetical protein
MPGRIIDEVVGHLQPVDWSEFITMMPGDRTTIISVAITGAPVFDRRTPKIPMTLIPEQSDATVGQRLALA